jgi:hypothetical protein
MRELRYGEVALLEGLTSLVRFHDQPQEGAGRWEASSPWRYFAVPFPLQLVSLLCRYASRTAASSRV